ncbi:hypothetical protein [Nocardia sp. NPDC047654]|uniref:hypothetical protein n=1 Tax=Nocardia sp. NPDC047654 TaxID=3364314 RepID=UPI00371FF3F9
MIYPLVRELAADGIPVAVTCRVLKIARQPYYRWLADPVTASDLEQAYRADALFDAHRDDPEFGYRFLVDEAAAAGEPMAARTAWRICSANKWWSSFGKKRSSKDGRSDPPVHDDLVARNFTADAPNMLWLMDITEHSTAWIPVVVATLLEGGGVGWSEVLEGAAGVVLRSAGSWRQCQGRGDRGRGASWCGVYVAAEKWIGDAPGDSARLHRAGEGRVLSVAGRTRERLGCCA